MRGSGSVRGSSSTATSGVVRVDSAPAFDAPPAADELLRLAARNHELEQTYHSARTAAVSTRHDAQRELRERVAQAFMADPSQRAVAHPPPTQRRCCIQAEGRRIVFDVAEDPVLAKGVALEATRRFREDQRVKREQNLQERAKQLALHEEKKRYVAEWIAANGTPDQQARQAAGVLPMVEAVEAITKQAFAPLSDFRPYVHDGADRLREVNVRENAGEAVVLAANDLRVNTEPAKTATAAQWAVIALVRERVPDADVTLLRHRISLRSATPAPSVTVHTGTRDSQARAVGAPSGAGRTGQLAPQLLGIVSPSSPRPRIVAEEVAEEPLQPTAHAATDESVEWGYAAGAFRRSAL